MYFSCLMDGENVRTDTEECFGKKSRYAGKTAIYAKGRR